MFKQTLVSIAVALTAVAVVPTYASADEAQVAAHSESSVAASTQVAARSNTAVGDADQGGFAAKAQSGNRIAPDPKCVGPASFCTPFFGS